MKQVLSVADFAVILNLVNEKIEKMEYNVTHRPFFDDDERKNTSKLLQQLRRSQLYKSLIHLKESLENLNVEVETPNVEIKEN